MTAADLIAERLRKHGCHHIFAISGAGNMFLFDAIAREPELQYICPHHEQAGAMAAIAYSRATEPRRLGVMVTTGGPGAVNAITGALNAWADSIPVLIISGQEKLSLIEMHRNLRMWGVQGFDIVRAVKGITKYALMLTDPNTVEAQIDMAVHEATTGRPGPVWLDIPLDIQAATVEPANQAIFHAPEEAPVKIGLEVTKFLALFNESSRPVFILGNGIRLAGGHSLLPELLERFPIPVITAWNGMDMVESAHPLNFGRSGVYGQRCGNFVVQNADLVVSIGTRMAIPQIGYDFGEYARGAKKVMVDIDGEELRKFNPPLDLSIQADAREFLTELLAQSKNQAPVSVAPWLRRCNDWKRRYSVIEPGNHKSRPGAMNAYQFIDELNRHLGPDDAVVVGAGAAHTCTQQVIHLKAGQRIVASTGLGEMGNDLPASIGVAFARPGKRVVLVTGDGSIMMNLQELQTIRHHNLPIKIFLYENDGYLTIRNTQNALFGGRQAGSGRNTGVTCPDFQKLLTAFGFPVFSAQDIKDVPTVIDQVMAGEFPAAGVLAMDPVQLFAPKLSVSTATDGSLVSPPLEDLSPLLPREQLEAEMIVGVHPKSKALEPAPPVEAKV
jgi:acetolactate synthase-1/2/3 large subunit